MKKKLPPPHARYEKPVMRVIEILNSSALLQTSPVPGQGVIPPTENNNLDNDW